uniref:Uncharacterized protein n=1 Tax=Oryza punctata TaxID=4537 RepID=A0A0E0LUW5_ORYPU
METRAKSDEEQSDRREKQMRDGDKEDKASGEEDDRFRASAIPLLFIIRIPSHQQAASSSPACRPATTSTGSSARSGGCIAVAQALGEVHQQATAQARSSSWITVYRGRALRQPSRGRAVHSSTSKLMKGGKARPRTDPNMAPTKPGIRAKKTVTPAPKKLPTTPKVKKFQAFASRLDWMQD